MKVALASSVVPFVGGGARFIVEWLEEKLLEHGHSVERIYLPFTENTTQEIFDQMAAYRLVDCAAADRLITFRPPAHVIPHPNKVIWFIHHIRSFYDLWETPLRSLPETIANKAFRARLFAADNVALREAKRVFTNSQVVSDRLLAFNEIRSEPLYPPLGSPERFRCDVYGDYVAYVSRVEPVKRQDLLVRAMQFVKSPVKVRIYGESSSPLYIQEIQNIISRFQLQEVVVFRPHWLAEEEKVSVLADSLAVAYLPFDEDSYGYPCLEAFHSSKPVLTLSDSGGVLELVQEGICGRVIEPTPHAIAEALDELYLDQIKTRCMGLAAKQRVAELKISWDHVIVSLLQ